MLSGRIENEIIEFNYGLVLINVSVQMRRIYPNRPEFPDRIIKIIDSLKELNVIKNELECIDKYLMPFTKEGLRNFEQTKEALNMYFKPDYIDTGRTDIRNFSNILETFYKINWTFVEKAPELSRSLFQSLSDWFELKKDFIIQYYFTSPFADHLYWIIHDMHWLTNTPLLNFDESILFLICDHLVQMDIHSNFTTKECESVIMSDVEEKYEDNITHAFDIENDVTTNTDFGNICIDDYEKDITSISKLSEEISELCEAFGLETEHIKKIHILFNSVENFIGAQKCLNLETCIKIAEHFIKYNTNMEYSVDNIMDIFASDLGFLSSLSDGDYIKMIQIYQNMDLVFETIHTFSQKDVYSLNYTGAKKDDLSSEVHLIDSVIKNFVNILKNELYRDPSHMCSFLEWIDIKTNYTKNVCDEARSNATP